MNSKSDVLLSEHVQLIKYGEALTKDYFYIPILYYEDEEFYESHTLFYESADGTLVDNAYAGKVNAGETLWQAVRRDLGKDFNYPKDATIMIDNAILHDTAHDKHGVERGRVLVGIQVAKFDTAKVRPLDMRLHWEDEIPEKTKLSFSAV